MAPGGALARVRVGSVARRRPERRDDRGQDEAHNADLVEDRAGDDAPEAADVGVGEEGAEDDGEAGGAAEVGERVRRVHQRHVQLLRQVRDQIGVEAGRGELVADLVCCNGQPDR